MVTASKMIASRSITNKQREEEVELLSADNSLFAGLNFPSVPTAPVAVKSSSSSSELVDADELNEDSETSALLPSYQLDQSKGQEQPQVSHFSHEIHESLVSVDSPVASTTRSESHSMQATHCESKALDLSSINGDVQNHQQENKLSALYHSDAMQVDVSNLYPDLPSIDIRSNSNNNMIRASDSVAAPVSAPIGNLNTAANQSYYETSATQGLPQSSHQSTYTSTTTAVTTTAASVAVPVTESSVDSSLLDDLMRENQRLADEVANLKHMVETQARLQSSVRSEYLSQQTVAQQHQQQLQQQQQHQQQGQQQQQQQMYAGQQPQTSAHNTYQTLVQQQIALGNQQQILQQQMLNQQQAIHTSTSIDPLQQQQQQQQRAIQMQEEALRNYNQRRSNEEEASIGQPISDVRQPPQRGLKYVCCGGCRRWMSAAKESVYVVCSNCDSINNCNLLPKTPSNVPTATAVPNEDLQRRAITTQSVQSSQSFLPWFLDCFSKPSEDS